MKPFIRIGILLISMTILSGCTKSPQVSDQVDQIIGTEESAPLPVIEDVDFSASSTPATQAEQVEPSSDKNLVAVELDQGTIVIELAPQIAPGTVKNFTQKVADGFYDGLTFHRVEDWVIQGGDPLGTGTGGGSMPTEFSRQPFVAGSVGVARGPDRNVSNDAQFFICVTDCAWLTGEYTWFGQVVSGLEVLSQVKVNQVMKSVAVVNP